MLIFNKGVSLLSTMDDDDTLSGKGLWLLQSNIGFLMVFFSVLEKISSSVVVYNKRRAYSRTNNEEEDEMDYMLCKCYEWIQD